MNSNDAPELSSLEDLRQSVDILNEDIKRVKNVHLHFTCSPLNPLERAQAKEELGQLMDIMEISSNFVNTKLKRMVHKDELTGVILGNEENFESKAELAQNSKFPPSNNSNHVDNYASHDETRTVNENVMMCTDEHNYSQTEEDRAISEIEAIDSEWMQLEQWTGAVNGDATSLEMSLINQNGSHIEIQTHVPVEEGRGRVGGQSNKIKVYIVLDVLVFLILVGLILYFSLTPSIPRTFFRASSNSTR